MDKKQLLTVFLLAAAGALLLNLYLNKSKEGAQSEEPVAAKEELGHNDWKPIEGEWTVSCATFPADAEMPKVLLGSLDPDGDYKFQAQLDPRGASVYTLKLAGIYDTVEHKRSADKTPEQLRQWSYSLLNPKFEDESARTILPFATVRLSVHGMVDAGVESVLFDNRLFVWDSRARDEQGAPKNEPDVTRDENGVITSARFRMMLRRGSGAEGQWIDCVELIKTYTVAKGSNSLSMVLEMRNLLPAESDESLGLGLIQYGPTGVPREDLKTDMRSVCVGDYIPANKAIEVPRVWENAKLGDSPIGKEESTGGNSSSDPVVWAGQVSKFFACLMYPVSDEVGDVANVKEDSAPDALAVPKSQYTYTFYRRVVDEGSSKTQLVYQKIDPVNVKPGKSVVLRYDVYCGPKSDRIFASSPLYTALNYNASIQFGGCSWCTFSWLTQGIMWLIQWLGTTIGNYGVAIILLVLAMRLALHPITKKSQVSMMKLQKLGPEMEKIKQKFKDDKEGQQKATMEFMRKQGASPILGCLPMFLQMPIWIALWQGLSATADLRHASFLPFWVTDLAAPDALIAFPAHAFSIPLLSGMMGPIWSLNLLPLLLTVFMYLQQKLSPMSGATSASPEQRKQQKIMMVMMTGFFLLIFYNAPSGLTLYVMASTAGGVLESYAIRKHIREKEALAAATETFVDAPGKAPRGQRPKKAKGSQMFKYK